MNEKSNSGRKKQITVLALIIAALLAVLVIINVIIDGGFPKKQRKEQPGKNPSIHLFEPDYDENIFDDDEYMGLDRFITYTDGALTIRAVTYDELKTAGKFAETFGSYFDAVIRGDNQKYNSFFTEKYIEKNGLKSNFTMQKIYGIDIRKLSDTAPTDTNDDKSRAYVFEVRYAIYENNGTFRDDISSDTVRPQIYEVCENTSSGEILINSISEYNRK